ncbi:MAG: hypothetical protein AAGI03_12805 [Pseudomonadota bacterium]
MIRALRSLGLVIAAASVSGACTLSSFSTGPEAFSVAAAPMVESGPVDAPVAFVETRLRRGNGVVYNRLGGEVPRGAPIEPVEERDLGEVTTPNAG